MKTTYRFKELPRTYGQLVDLLPPRPIHSESEYDEVQDMIDALVGFKLNKDQADYLDALSTFLEAYEEEHYPIDTSDIGPLEMLKFHMENHNMTPSELASVLGCGKSATSMILSGKRGLSKVNIRKLADHFHCSTDLFLD